MPKRAKLARSELRRLIGKSFKCAPYPAILLYVLYKIVGLLFRYVSGMKQSQLRYAAVC